jgi:AraC-like DNA-binding protein
LLSHLTPDFKKELPEHFPGPRLPGGEVMAANGKFGVLCIQEYDGGDFLVRYSFLETNEPVRLDAISLHSGMHMVMMIRNGVDLVFETNSIKIEEGQFTILLAEKPNAIVSFEEKKQYTSLEIIVSDSMAQSILSDFPELLASYQKPETGPPIIWVDPPEWTEEEAKDHIHYLLTYSDLPRWRRNYFENRVRDIMWKQIVSWLKMETSENKTHRDDRRKVNKVERLILDNLDKHALIGELAKEVNMSESKLKRVFSKVFGMGIHQYRIYQRLKKAVQLLHEGMSVKEAAAKTGWNSADLIDAYTKVYHTTPGTIKKRKG